MNCVQVGLQTWILMALIVGYIAIALTMILWKINIVAEAHRRLAARSDGSPEAGEPSDHG